MTNDPKSVRPFDAKFVIRETFRHIQRAVDTSTQKTMLRIPEFEGDNEKAKEVLLALSSLGRINRMIEEIRANNKDIFDA